LLKLKLGDKKEINYKSNRAIKKYFCDRAKHRRSKQERLNSSWAGSEPVVDSSRSIQVELGKVESFWKRTAQLTQMVPKCLKV